MTRLNVQDRTTLAKSVLVVALKGCRRDVIDYVSRTYPDLHVVSFVE